MTSLSSITQVQQTQRSDQVVFEPDEIQLIDSIVKAPIASSP